MAGPVTSTLDVTLDTIRNVFWFYVMASGVLAALLLNLRRLPMAVVQWTAVTEQFAGRAVHRGHGADHRRPGQLPVLAVCRL